MLKTHTKKVKEVKEVKAVKAVKAVKEVKAVKAVKAPQLLYNGPALPLSQSSLPPYLVRRQKQLLEGNARSLANPSYGWKLRSPQRGSARHLLHEKCGNKCFLQPEREGFPVCAKYELTAPSCKFDCGGISTAYRRALQYKYPLVAKKAKALSKILC
jgi:hypothetical protein